MVDAAADEGLDYFDLLGLDLDASWSDERFREAVAKKRPLWSRESNNDSRADVRDRASKLLSTSDDAIARIMRDSAYRAKMRSKRAAKRGQEAARLDTLIELQGAKGFLTPREAEALNLRFKGLFTEQEIGQRIKVEIREEQTDAEEPTLPAHTVDNIKLLLHVVGAPDLYTFLKTDPDSKNELEKIRKPRREELEAAAKVLEREVRTDISRQDKALKDARKELAGYCLTAYPESA